MIQETELTDRQRRENAYHAERAKEMQHIAETAVALDIIVRPQERWWNAQWFLYSMIKRLAKPGMRALVVGCGFGGDAVLLTHLGFEVYAFDLSSDSLDIARRSALRSSTTSIDFRRLASEKLDYADDFFHFILFVDILHHVNIAATMDEIGRVAAPDAIVVGQEIYTFSLLDRVRNAAPVRRYLYPRLVRIVYGTDRPYITADERKMSEKDIDEVLSYLSDPEIHYFKILSGRVLPNDTLWANKLERLMLRASPTLGRLLAGRVVFTGRMSPDHRSRASSINGAI
jgi:2-polyprenyl-3-methyl-5-hydroxy-6-metoxy-1,4-benzoquinol methylase